MRAPHLFPSPATSRNRSTTCAPKPEVLITLLDSEAPRSLKDSLRCCGGGLPPTHPLRDGGGDVSSDPGSAGVGRTPLPPPRLQKKPNPRPPNPRGSGSAARGEPASSCGSVRKALLKATVVVAILDAGTQRVYNGDRAVWDQPPAP